MMDELHDRLKTHGEIHFKVKVVPSSSQTKDMGTYGDCLKIKIASPPENFRANKELLAFLSEKFPGSTISIIRGGSSTIKTIKVTHAIQK